MTPEPNADGPMKLARMSRQIADFFKAYPQEQAVPAIAQHINKFWSRRMRADFLAAFKSGDDRLDPLVAAAIPQIRGQAPAEHPE
jgi:formate dehydrogenase subunit delta